MNRSTPQNALKVKTVELGQTNSQTAQLEKQAGMLGRFSASRAVQKSAASALQELRQHEINAAKDIRKTAINLATSTVKAAMVAEAMPALGTLTTQLNMATGNVDQALTNGAAVETYTHFTNRQQNLDLIASLRTEGKITEEEAQVLKDQIQSDSYTDIHRTRDRTAAAKETVAAIHSYGVASIQHAKDAL